MTLGELKIIIRSYLDGGLSVAEFKDRFPFNRMCATDPATLLRDAVAGAVDDCFREGHNIGIPFERKEKRLKQTLNGYLHFDWQQLLNQMGPRRRCDKCGALSTIMVATKTPLKHLPCRCGGTMHTGNGCCPSRKP
jgi:hypothetical protein